MRAYVVVVGTPRAGWPPRRWNANGKRALGVIVRLEGVHSCSMARTQTKESRLAVRLTAEQRERIDQAAAAEGRTVTDFAIAALSERAGHVLADRRIFPVGSAQWERFVELLDQPVRSLPRLAELLARDPGWAE